MNSAIISICSRTCKYTAAMILFAGLCLLTLHAQAQHAHPDLPAPTDPPGAPGPVEGPEPLQGPATGTYTYTVTPASGTVSVYIWSTTAGSISGSGTTATLTLSNYTGSFTISCSASNSIGTTPTLEPLNVTVYPALVAGAVSPVSQNINYNTPATVSSAAPTGGNGLYAYQWQSSPNNTTWTNVTGGSGATTLSYTSGSLTNSSSSTYFHLLATSNGVTKTGNTATVTVYPQLVTGAITSGTQTINYGAQPAHLVAAAATGGSGSYAYQWKSSPSGTAGTFVNVTTGTGATTTTYTPSTLTAKTYYQLISTSNGVSVTSSTVTVTVYPQLVSGTISPATQTINYNAVPGSLTEAAATGGSGTYTYQWQNSPNNATWTNISGATALTYAPPALTATTYYHLISTSNGAPVTGSTATVTVYPQLVAGTVTPATQSVNYNTTAVLTGTAATGGSGTYTYQWQNSPNGTTWTNITGATAASYTTGSLTAATTYYHRISTSNGVSVTGAMVTVSAYPQLVAGTVSPASQSINYNTTATLTGTAATGGNGTYTYQWQNSPDGTTWTNITGATAVGYTTGSLTAATTYYHRISTSNGISVTGATATVSAYPQLVTGLLGPASQNINYNTIPLGMTGTVGGGNGTYTYQWQSSPNNSTWTNVTGATAQGYNPPALVATTYYRRALTSNGASVTSASVVITVYSQLAAGAITPATQTIVSNGTAGSLTCAPSGGNGTYTYQWQSSADNVSFSNITVGGTGSSYSPGTVTATTYYRVSVTSNGAAVFSNSAAVIITECIPLVTNVSAAQNYIRTSVPRIPGYNPLGAGYSTCDVNQTIQYFDGLGRPSQTVQVKGSTSDRDVVQPVAYDQFGREAVKYLPYAVTGAAASDGSYKPNAITDQAGFYTAPPAGVSAIPYANAQTGFEPSPLNRVLEQGAPGVPWQLSTSGVTGSGHTNKMVYTANNSIAWASDSVNSMQVALYNVVVNADQSRTLSASSYYGAGQLQVTVSKDENWVSGRAGTTEEYKDKEGHVLLKRVYNYTTVLQVLSTYYVYDDLDNLAFVLPPAAGGDAAAFISQATLDNLCYQYRYDERNRLTEKKIPGKGWVFMVYNTIDQVVMTQDANQRNNTPQQWTFTKYDAQGRSIATGLYTYSGSTADASISAPAITELTALQTLYKNTANPKWENRNSTATTGYDELTDPIGHSYTYYTVNYYDNYTGIPGLPATYTLTSGVSQMTTGLPTVKKTAVLNTPTDQLWDVMYYDDLGRATKTYAQHYLGGTANTSNYDLTTTTYNFNNQPTTVTRAHWNTASTTVPLVTIANTYLYDHTGRKLKTWEQITNGNSAPTTKTLISKIDYNEIGQVLNKHLHSTDSVTFLENIAYTYNERGWLLTSTAPLFVMQLNYNTNPTNKAYNGNIMYQFWGVPGNINHYYVYTYDKLNRLKSGLSDLSNNENNIAYDPMGNITALQRYQAGTLIDNLAYTYNSTNQLQSITDATASDAGLKHGTWNYTYDGNGNLITDPSKGTGGLAITYNLLNLPQNVTGGQTVTYTYDALGNKLRKLNPNTLNTDYINGIQYDGTTTPALSFIQTEEGKALVDGTGYNYVYYLGDNLGNTRITFDTKTGVASQTQKDDYYPFGMEINTAVNGIKNEYLYNKKELQEELGEYDYGARFYDPVIGRWNVVDPLAEESRRWSPYNYVENDPIRHTDPDGMQCDGCRTAEAIFGGGLVAGGLMIGGAAPTVVGEVVAVPAAAVTVTATTIAAGTVLLYHAIFGSHDSAPKLEKGPPNPNGSKGKPDHQEKVKELAEKAKAEHPGKDVLQEKKIQVDGSNRRPDVQVVDPQTGKTTKVYEAERKPNSDRNKKREAEYKKHGVDNETHKVGN